jgi:multicomponent Na+:H+ antiporter subunit F
MTLLLAFMLFTLLFPAVHSFRTANIWERMLCYTSISTRAAVVLIIFSRYRHDVMIGLVAVIVLCVGNSGLLLLARLIKGLEDECD